MGKRSIYVTIYKTETGRICGFVVREHAKNDVCAAVSLLVLNTVNSIECLTQDRFICDYDKSGGYLSFLHPALASGGESHDASLLLDSLALGLYGVKDEYGKDIHITEEVRHD